MRTILVIDDEPDIVLMVRLALEFAGYRVLEAGTGEEGLAIVEREEPDGVLLDLRLPGIDGWGVIEQLRSAGRLPGSPVIIISAHASPGTPKRATDAGCSGYLRKPFHPDDLIKVIRDVVPA